MTDFSNMNMPKLDLQEYKCYHKNVKAVDNSTKFKKCILNCKSCYGYTIHNHQIIYQKGVCNDCSQKFIIKTIIRTPNYICPLYKISSSFENISITKCCHPCEAFNINENTIKRISFWWTWWSSKSNEAWINASGECLLCNSKIHVQRKYTGTIKDNKQVQNWSNWILT